MCTNDSIFYVYIKEGSYIVKSVMLCCCMESEPQCSHVVHYTGFRICQHNLGALYDRDLFNIQFYFNLNKN